MLSPPALTEQHISRFQKNGCVVLRKAALSAEEISEIDYSFCPNQGALEKLQKAVTAARKDS